MAGRFAETLESWHQRQSERRWTRLADAAPQLDTAALKAARSQARGLKRTLDRILHVADARMAIPALGSGLPTTPIGTDWSWRPDLWRGALAEPGAIAATDCTALDGTVAVYHDCPLGEVALRQLRNDREQHRAPYGLALDVFGFRGSFLSVAIGLPSAGVEGLKTRHIGRVDLVIEADRPVNGFVRLNVKHGANVAQMINALPTVGQAMLAEFDLAYSGIDEERVENAWLDIIFKDPAMTRVVVRDAVVSRRPRAEL